MFSEFINKYNRVEAEGKEPRKDRKSEQAIGRE